jgi:hypothetical protein
VIEAEIAPLDVKAGQPARGPDFEVAVEVPLAPEKKR